MITATTSALAHIRKCITKRGNGIGIRLHATEAGCSGYKYEISYIDSINTQDKPLDDALSIVVDKKVFPYLMGTVIDYRQEGLNYKFVFENPNQTGACGCGESFTVD